MPVVSLFFDFSWSTIKMIFWNPKNENDQNDHDQNDHTIL